jgi:UDP-N-acetyl-D-mannosaminuronate dehydrogenase
MDLKKLHKNINSKTATIGLVGPGYAGLAVVCKFATADFSVIGLECIPEKVEMINAGILPIRSDEPGLEPEVLSELGFVFRSIGWGKIPS